MEGFFRRYMMLHRPLVNQLNELLSGYDLSYSLWQVIYYVKNNGPASLVEISNYYNIEKPTITRNVQRLEAKHLIEEIPGQDRREKIIQMTNCGEELYQSCRMQITQLEYRVMQGVSEEEQAVLIKTIPKIKENILHRERAEYE